MKHTKPDVFVSHRTMCSFGSHMLLSVRNGYVKISWSSFSTAKFGLDQKTVSSHSNNDVLHFTHQGTKGQISKVFSAMLAIHPDKPGTEDCDFLS